MAVMEEDDEDEDDEDEDDKDEDEDEDVDVDHDDGAASPPLRANPSVPPLTIAKTKGCGRAVLLGLLAPGVPHAHSPFSRSASTHGPVEPSPPHQYLQACMDGVAQVIILRTTHVLVVFRSRYCASVLFE